MVEVALWNSPLMIGRDHLEGSALSSFSPQEKQLWLLTRKFLVTDLMITQKVAKVPPAQKDWRMTIPILSVGRFCFWRFWHILTHSRIFLPEDAFPLSLFYNSASFSFPISWLPETKEIKGMYLSYFNGNSFFWVLGILSILSRYSHDAIYYKVSKGLRRNYLRLPLWKAWSSCLLYS